MKKYFLFGDEAVKCYLSAYPVFIMFEQLYLTERLDFTYGLDAVWEHCVIEYMIFQKSNMNDSNKSEYDCIRDYVNTLNPVIGKSNQSKLTY